MTDSEFWSDLEAKFQALQPSGIPVKPGLRAFWTSGVWNETGAQWLLLADEPLVTEEFKSLAEEAAGKYGWTSLIQDADGRWKLGGEAALFFWLDVLKRESGKYKSDYGPVRHADGSDAQGERGRINRICAVAADYCGKLARRGATPAGSGPSLPSIEELRKSAIGMGRPSRHEIEKFANDAFAMAGNGIRKEYDERQDEVLRQVRLSGNVGGYVPALIACGAERVRAMVLALANAYVEAFTLHRVPSDVWAETNLETGAQQIVAGTVSGLRGQLDLLEKRTKMPINDSGGHLDREIGAAMKSALQDGVFNLVRQRVKSKSSQSISEGMPSDRKAGLENHLKATQELPDNPKLRKMYEAVSRYNWYLKEFRALKIATKKFQTPDLLKKRFPQFDVWAVLEKDDERAIASGDFDPGRFSWALVRRLNGLKGNDDRTLKNYRKALRVAGISV